MASHLVGFALMKASGVLNVAYERSPLVQRNQEEFRHFRERFKNIDSAAYRGVERWALSELPEPDPGWIHTTPPPRLTGVDEEARRHLSVILGSDHECDHYPCSLIPTFAQATHLKRLVDQPDTYEIVRLSQGHSNEGPPALGYDVGYWGGGNYSILCDSVIWPMWHGPVPEAFDALAAHVSCLNAHMLFPDHESADQFRSFYVTQPWGESEATPGEFTVIRIAAME